MLLDELRFLNRLNSALLMRGPDYPVIGGIMGEGCACYLSPI
jgi:hypothetical protein